MKTRMTNCRDQMEIHPIGRKKEEEHIKHRLFTGKTLRLTTGDYFYIFFTQQMSITYETL
jgi:hypothetical protein